MILTLPTALHPSVGCNSKPFRRVNNRLSSLPMQTAAAVGAVAGVVRRAVAVRSDVPHRRRPEAGSRT